MILLSILLILCHMLYLSRELLAAGAALDAQDECQITPLFTAAHYGKHGCLKLMLEAARERGR